MELAVVSPADYFEGEGKLINQLFGCGLQVLHLRKPENDPLKFRKLMAEIHPSNYPCIAIHQHHELAEEFSITRLHYTEQRRKEMFAYKMERLIAAGFRLSSSVHELSALTNLLYLDYVFFGPVFNSISKVGYKAVLEADFVLHSPSVKVFAIGGVSADRLKDVKKMNFDGIAVLGSIWHQPGSPVMELIKIIKLLNEISNDHR